MTKMLKLTLAALVAAFALTSTAGAAVVGVRVPPPKTTPTPITTPSNPGGPTGSVVTFSDYDCTLEMGHLRLIRPAQLEEAGYDGIVIQPVCEGEQSAAARNAGNAVGLRGLLGTKADVVEALAAQDYVAEEIVGVRFGGGDTLVLYVHHYR
jgi:hypothetical protein